MINKEHYANLQSMQTISPPFKNTVTGSLQSRGIYSCEDTSYLPILH